MREQVKISDIATLVPTSNVDITPMAGGRYKISATRFSLMKKYSSPMTWIVGQEFGKWVIMEEHSESRP